MFLCGGVNSVLVFTHTACVPSYELCDIRAFTPQIKMYICEDISQHAVFGSAK